jgi:hypothetical protein
MPEQLTQPQDLRDGLIKQILALREKLEKLTIDSERAEKMWLSTPAEGRREIAMQLNLWEDEMKVAKARTECLCNELVDADLAEYLAAR